MRLRRLNEAGLERMGSFLDSLTTETPENQPRSILADPESSEDLPIAIDINGDVAFNRRFEAAAYLYERLAPLRTLALMQLERDRGLWAWLSLFWFERLCPPDQNGGFRPGNRSRWIPLLDDPRRYYRHLLLGPYLMYRTHAASPEILEPILSNALHVGTSEVFRTIIETQQFVTSAPVVALIGRLYYDSRTRRLIRGTGAKTGGGVRRLGGDILKQLDLTFDLHSIRVDDLVALLPDEFLAIRRRTKTGRESRSESRLNPGRSV